MILLTLSAILFANGLFRLYHGGGEWWHPVVDFGMSALFLLIEMAKQAREDRR